MTYFPISLNIENKNILLVGGGTVAFNKLEKLLMFTKNIKIVAPEIIEDLEKIATDYGLSLEKRLFCESDLAGVDILVVAVDDISLQKRVHELTRGLNILVNCVDLPEQSDFIFPSIGKKGDLVVAVSTSGITPSLAKGVKDYFMGLIPESIEGFIKEIAQIRANLPKGKERQELLIAKSTDFLKEHFRN